MKHKIMRLTVIALLFVAHTTTFIRPTSAEIFQKFRVTFTFSLENECLNETIEGTVTLHQIWIINAGKIDSIHSNTIGTGVGLSSGNKYVIKEIYKDDFSNFDCGVTVYGHVRQRLISLGKAPNAHVDFLVTYDTDANCNPLPVVYTPTTTHCN